jgi:sugar phosphate isomerase/epimerase
VVGRLVHLHAKDISIQHSRAERGKVTGTPVGCACGDGVIDWARIVRICRKAQRDLVFSVECGTVEQAARSIQHLKKALRG